MSTQALSTRLEINEVEEIDRLAEELGLDRSALLKQIIRRGCEEIRLQQAVTRYRRGEMTLSAAARTAGMSLRGMLLALERERIELNYDLTEVRRDMASE